MPNFETRLKEERKRLGLKGGQLAQLGGVSAVSQSCYEKGKQLPGATYLAAIAAAGVDVQYVLTGQRSSEPVLTPEEKAVLAAWKKAPEQIQMAVLAVLATGQCSLGGVNLGGDNNGLIATNGGTIGKIKRWKK